MQHPLDVIRIHELELSCIVGLRPHERQTEQRLVLDVDLLLDGRTAGHSGRIGDTVDYDLVADAVSAMLRFRRYRLMEVAGEELCAMLLGTHPQLREVRLKLQKPDALPGRARSASVTVTRRREELALPERGSRDLGDDARGCDGAVQTSQVARILRTADAELSVVHVPPQGTWQPHAAPGSRCLHWLIAGRLTGPERDLAPGLIESQGQAAPLWSNLDPTDAVVFQCWVPRSPAPGAPA